MMGKIRYNKLQHCALTEISEWPLKTESQNIIHIIAFIGTNQATQNSMHALRTAMNKMYYSSCASGYSIFDQCG